MPKFNVRRAVVSAGLCSALAFSGTALAFATEGEATPTNGNDGIMAAVATDSYDCKVTFVLDNGQNDKETIVNSESFITYPYGEPTRDGYTFKGFSTTRGGQPVASLGDVALNPNGVTLYAVWQENAPASFDCTVTFVLGNGQDDKETIVNSESFITYPYGEPTRDGYTFKGFSTTPGGEPVASLGDVALSPDGVTLYAVWEENAPVPAQKATITFWNGDNHDWASSEYTVGETIYAWAVTPGAPEGQHFEGFAPVNTDGVISGPVIDIASGYTIEGNTVLTAVFVDDAPEAFDCKVTFKLGNGQADQVITVGSDSFVTYPYAEPSRLGYMFMGFSTSENGPVVDLDDVELKPEGVTLYAVWQQEEAAQDVTVRFLDDDGTELSIATYKAGDTLSVWPSTPSRDGYVFLGYAIEGKEDQIVDPKDIVISADGMTFVAVWQKIDDPIQYATATFVMADGTTREATYQVGSVIGTWPVIPAEREGYEFLGYSIQGKEGVIVDPAQIPMSSTGMTFVAEWQKIEDPVTMSKVTFLDEDGSVIGDATYQAGTIIGTWPVEPAHRAGYHFDGYAIQGKEDDGVVDPALIPVSTSDMTFVAVWSVEQAQEYTATFVSEGEVIGDAKYAAGTTIYNWPVTPKYREGYTFIGYAIEGKEADGPVDPTLIPMPENDITFVALWEKNEVQEATATFLDADGTELGTAVYKAGEVIYRWPIEPADREGYEFLGYAIQGKEDDGVVDPTMIPMSTDGMTFVAVWEKVEDPIVQSTVTFLDEDGTELGSAVYNAGEIIGVWPIEPAEREGYTFKGYAIQDKEADGVVDPAQIPVSTDGMTFVAVWEKNETPVTPVTQHTVTFVDELHGTTIQTVNDGEAVAQPEDPTAEGYVFGGWMLGEDAYDFATPVTSNLTLTAKWTEETPAAETHKVTFVNTLDNSSDVVEVVDGQKVEKPADPAAEGKTFTGWTLADGTAYDFDAAVTEDLVLYTAWSDVTPVTPTDPETPENPETPATPDDGKDEGTDNGVKDDGKKEESKKDESKAKDQLPKTADDTNVAGVAAAGVAGVAALGAGAALLSRRKREQN